MSTSDIRDPLTRRLLLTALAALCTSAVACTLYASRTHLRGSAPQILRELVSRWIDAACAAGLEIAIKHPLGPPQGSLDPNLEAVLEGRGDFAFLTREISERDLSTYRVHHAGRLPLIVPVAAGMWDRFGYIDAVVVIVNGANPIPHISFRALDAIFSTTRWRGEPVTTEWGQLGLTGAWARRPIAIVGASAWRREESARALTIRRTVLSVEGRRGAWRDVPGGGDESEVVQQVGDDIGAIGFTGMGHISSRVRVLPVSAGEGPAVTLDSRSAAAGTYPLLRTVDLLVAADAAGRASPGAVRFAEFLLSPRGQAIVASQGNFAPLPSGTLARSLRDLDRWR